MGSFESEDANYMTCGKGIHNSITHINKDRKTLVQATWRAPQDFEGSVVFKYSLGSEVVHMSSTVPSSTFFALKCPFPAEICLSFLKH